jgi:hypothetical protein
MMDIWCAMAPMKASFGPILGPKLLMRPGSLRCAPHESRSGGSQMAEEGTHLVTQTVGLRGELA